MTVKLYNETDNKHPRGLIGMLIANALLERGWREEPRQGFGNLVDHVWAKGDVITTLEWAYELEFKRSL
jgi:hypothetical protein